MNNGSYSFTLEGGTVLNITVYVAPCGKCSQQDPHMAAPQQQRKTNRDMPLESATCTSGEYIQPFHQESTSPTAIEQVCEG